MSRTLEFFKIVTKIFVNFTITACMHLTLWRLSEGIVEEGHSGWTCFVGDNKKIEWEGIFV